MEALNPSQSIFEKLGPLITIMQYYATFDLSYLTMCNMTKATKVFTRQHIQALEVAMKMHKTAITLSIVSDTKLKSQIDRLPLGLFDITFHCKNSQAFDKLAIVLDYAEDMRLNKNKDMKNWRKVLYYTLNIVRVDIDLCEKFVLEHKVLKDLNREGKIYFNLWQDYSSVKSNDQIAIGNFTYDYTVSNKAFNTEFLQNKFKAIDNLKIVVNDLYFKQNTRFLDNLSQTTTTIRSLSLNNAQLSKVLTAI